MSISFIFATDISQAIGLGNDLPWRLPADLAYFKKTTLNHTILMGRKTYESMGKPLPNRTNVILTQNKAYEAEGCTIVHSVEEAVALFKNEEVFVIGGAEIFKLFMPLVDRMYITLIEHEFTADTYFPEFDIDEWELVTSEDGITDTKNPYTYSFLVYKKSKIHAYIRN
ncbi:MAG: dihydrofolate reductase [Paenibacillaceae bacterium]